MSYAIEVRVEAKMDSMAIILWVAAFVVASLLTWWDTTSRSDPVNPDDLVWIEVEQE